MKFLNLKIEEKLLRFIQKNLLESLTKGTISWQNWQTKNLLLMPQLKGNREKFPADITDTDTGISSFPIK
ncbi:MAG: hypothetical protein AYP45_14415 [Candidatus Brocadia carolinensis]|uniref:Uncharacterized protein n=1 Tax=Candidatus Brocadia carolinensis TaxID=1004156 RepID=A0A1V4AQW3_9BACT|nr:MAG: hypothetical protein AYP45_14415 [Candidatus Brocadia caroliniensis]